VKPYRSTQIGIGRGLSQKCVEEWIKSIKDVTEMAGRLRELVENAKGEGEKEMSVEELVERGTMPVERVY